MSILKRGKNSWRIKIDLGRGEDGTRKYFYETFYAPTKSLAKERESELIKKLKPGKQGPKTHITTLGQYLDMWLQEIQDTVSRSSWITYSSNARTVRPYIENLQLWALDSITLKTALNSKFDHLEDRTRKNLYAFVRMVVNAAINDKKAPHDALVGFRIPREERIHRNTLSRKEMNRLIKASEKYRYGLVIRLLVITGARAGEILGLTWDVVDFEKGCITINKAINLQKLTITDRPKTENSRRTIILDSNTIDILQKHREKQKAELRKIAVVPLIQGAEKGLIFRTQLGHPPNYSMIQKTFRYCLKKAGLPNMRIHDLRHSLITLLLLEGISVLHVASLCGQDPNTTTKRYAHLIKVNPAITLNA